VATQYRALLTWPAGRPQTPSNERRSAPFRASLDATYAELDDELRLARARDAVVSIDAPAGQFRKNDSRPVSLARVNSPAVVLTFTSAEGHPVTIPCDRFHDWRDNLRAIALTLHDLRRVERYGTAASGQQYRGWAQLPSVTTTALNAEQAAEFLAKHGGGYMATEILRDAVKARHALRVVRAQLHPDNGGRSGDFALATDAGRVLATHHGIPSL
jgi:hypothetical protein